MYPLRSTSLALLTIGQILTEYRFHKNPVQLRGKEAGLSDRLILVSGPFAYVPEERRRLPNHIEFSDGTVMVLVRNGNQRVIDSKNHKDDHRRSLNEAEIKFSFQKTHSKKMQFHLQF